MFDIGWQELFIVAILAIIVIGPKDLPRAVRTVMRAIRKLRSMAGEFQAGLDEVAREAELDDIRREANKIAHYDVTKEIKDNLDPDGEIEKAADLDGAVRETMTEAKSASTEAAQPAADAPVTATTPPPPSEPVTTAEPAAEPAADTAKT
ncbi:MAG: Sec-independent protein translocase protein TatB [Alphaproteobacteria bacterium]|nr:twin-arginine translocase subunit TatB [bacterium SCSIO 12827]